MHNFLYHHGIKGQKWGVKNGPPYPVDRKRVFISGSSKTQTSDNPYYRKDLPKDVQYEIKKHTSKGHRILVGEAPGIDSQVQDFLKANKYRKVTVYTSGDEPRYLADKKWKVKKVNASQYPKDSKEFLRQKDIAMTKDATEGLAIILEKGGAGATRNNIKRLLDQGKTAKAYMLLANGLDQWVQNMFEEVYMK